MNWSIMLVACPPTLHIPLHEGLPKEQRIGEPHALGQTSRGGAPGQNQQEPHSWPHTFPLIFPPSALPEPLPCLRIVADAVGAHGPFALLPPRFPRAMEGKEEARGWGSAAGPAAKSRLAVVLGCRWPCLSGGGGPGWSLPISATR